MKELMNITNQTLNVQIQEIIRLENESRRNLEKIAVILCNIDKNKHYALEGFDSTAAMAEKVLGYKKQTVTNMIKVAERFLETQDKNLIVDGEKFGVSQLLELKALTDSQIKENLGGQLKPSMTTKQLRDAVHRIKGSKPSKKSTPKLPERLFKEKFQGNASKTAHIDRSEVTSLRITFEFIQQTLEHFAECANEASDAGVVDYINMVASDIGRIIKNRAEMQATQMDLDDNAKESDAEVESAEEFEPCEEFASEEEVVTENETSPVQDVTELDLRGIPGGHIFVPFDGSKEETDTDVESESSEVDQEQGNTDEKPFNVYMNEPIDEPKAKTVKRTPRKKASKRG